MGGEGERAGQFSAGVVAGPDRVAVLQLSRDGGTRDDIYRGDGPSGNLAMARKAVRDEVDAVATDDFDSHAVHREHGGMDDGGARPAAVADLWIDANGMGIEIISS